MAEAIRKSSRIALLATVCAAALSAGLFVGAPPSAAAQNQQQPPPKKKKLPPGAKGFEQYEKRDASDKLATGGATRAGELDDFKLAMKQGDELYEAGKYKEAAVHYARASKMKPDVFRALYALGSAHEAAGQFKEAAAAYKTAVALKPDPVSDDPNDPIKLQYALANSQASAGQHAEAVNSYRQVIDQIERAGAKAANPYYNLALSLDALGRQQEAVTALQKAVEINPEYAEAHYNLGVIHSRAERYAEAVESFKKALAARADYPEANYNLGLAYYLMDDNAGLAAQQKKLQAMNSPLAAELAKLAGGR
ncbi:MAG TPA: tetratricopeptide repeat protein [Pyrinomonadaceae bacterium]|nr:tetratricopeptide repeat protein [Pyrinomonadaceae bacterium]